MKNSDVMKELLNAYYCINGKCADIAVTSKAEKMIKQFEKAEKDLLK